MRSSRVHNCVSPARSSWVFTTRAGKVTVCFFSYFIIHVNFTLVKFLFFTQGLKLDEFESAYRSKYGKSFNVKTYGYETIRDLLSRMKETIIVRQHSDYTFIVSPRNMPLEPVTTNGTTSHCPKSQGTYILPR